jgi:multiple sugar transport system substrate-binding protein
MNHEKSKRSDRVNGNRKEQGFRLSRRRLLQVCAASALGASGLPRLARAAAPNISRKVSITYWTVLDHKDTKTARSRAEAAMVDLFRKKHPSIDVNVQIVPWQKMTQQIVLAAGAGKSPDVALASNRGLTTLVKAGAILPLNDYVGKDWTKEQKEDWLLPQENSIYDGRQMGVYWHVSLENLLFVNRALLEAKGAKIPRSLDEITQVGKILTQGRVTGYLMGLSKDGGALHLTNWLIPCLWGAGADWLDEKGRIAFNNEAGAKPFQWLLDMVHTHKVMPEGIVSITRDNVLDAFKTATVAISTLGSNIVAAARGSTVGKDMVLTVDAGWKADKPAPAHSTGKWMVIGKDCREKEAAGLFIEEQVSPEAQVINARIAAELPSRKSALKDPWFNTPEAADMRLMVEYVRQHGRTMPYHEQHLELAEMVGEAAQQIISKRKSVKDALDDVAKAFAAQIG